MSSNKQRREELKAERELKRQKLASEKKQRKFNRLEKEGAVCDPTQLTTDGSYDRPDYVGRGYYIDIPFTCKDCGKEEIWTAPQQKWWYEVAKGGVWTTARRCRDCRRIARQKKAEAQRVAKENTARNRLRKHKSAPHKYRSPTPQGGTGKPPESH